MLDWIVSIFAKDKVKKNLEAKPSSELYDMVVDMRWHRVLQHCHTVPLDAQYVDGDNLETPLYVACQQRPPVRVIRALLHAFPEALRQTSRQGDLPVHIACRYNASIDVLRELVAQAPETVAQQTKWGKTAVWALWEGRDTIDSDRGAENYATTYWQKMDVLLHAVARARNSPNHILHAAVSLKHMGCPDAVLEFAMDRYGTQILSRDTSGKLPLHIAVGPSHWSKASRRKYKPREQHVIGRLLKESSQAVLVKDPNEMGRYPIHTALSNRHQWDQGVKELFQASPQTLLVQDTITLLFPFQQAAVPVGDTKVDLDTVFQLLRQHPAVLGTHLTSDSTGHSILLLEGTEYSTNEASKDDPPVCFCGLVATVALGVFAFWYNTSRNRDLLQSV